MDRVSSRMTLDTEGLSVDWACLNGMAWRDGAE